MAHNPIFGSDPAKPASSAPDLARPGEWDLGELAAKLAEHGGGRVSSEISAELALQIVLNEIVEQACLATGASGAAIVLKRGGEWVCRASAGGSAPRLGARLDAESGLSGACVKTQAVQRCNDAESDTRADSEACRTLGIRSVIVLPLLQNGELAGVFEAFSTLPSAFGERDEHTLEALSRRVLNNLERASGPVSVSGEPVSGGPVLGAETSKSTPVVAEDDDVAIPAAAFSAETSDRSSDAEHDSLERPLPQAAREAGSGRGVNYMTLALGAAVLAYAVLLTVLVAQRMGWRRAAARGRAPAAVSVPVAGAVRPPASAGTAGSVGSGSQAAASTSSSTARSSTASTVPAAGASRTTDASPAAGSLMVYENGKEIFRMKPTVEPGGAADAGRTNPAEVTGATRGTGVQRASAVEAAGILEVPPDVAEGSLLHRVEPDYPEKARQQRIQGAVVLSVRIAQDGRVQSATVVSGPPLLGSAATDAVKQWRFKPRLVGGHPTEMRTRITLNFGLPQ
jgi:TonB family protein